MMLPTSVLRLPNKRLKVALTSREELRCLAGHLFLCCSTTLRPRPLRPQLKRDPLGRDALRGETV